MGSIPSEGPFYHQNWSEKCDNLSANKFDNSALKKIEIEKFIINTSTQIKKGKKYKMRK